MIPNNKEEIKSNKLPEVVVTAQTNGGRGSENFGKGRMNMYDSRLLRRLEMNVQLESSKGDGNGPKRDPFLYYPHFDYGSYVTDFHESPTSVQKTIEETTHQPNVKNGLKARKEYIEKFNKENEKKYLAARSFIHPYALVKFAGASGNEDTALGMFTYDKYYKRRYYEIDGPSVFSGHYSKTPTTTALIKWGNESPRGTTPYSFQDFVFCKWWNKIENNRLITLRRYAAPVTDNIEFNDFKTSEVSNTTDKGNYVVDYTDSNGTRKTKAMQGERSKTPWAPLATAVTYFGAETGNNLSELLSFSAKYKWSELNQGGENSPIDISSQQNDQGQGLVSPDLSGLTSGLGDIAKFMGFMGEFHNGHTINLDGAPQSLPPDPYKDGPYNNRILGPMNVITNVMRRDRGLEFHQDEINVKFSYVSRPIGGINNKAVLLDLMSNILVLTYSSGTWFGGMWRYRADNVAVYPWKYGDSMNKLYKGDVFGKNGFAMSLTKHVYSDGKSYLASFLPDAAKFISNLFKSAANAIMGVITGNESQKEQANREWTDALGTGTARAIQKVIAAKALRGATVPYIQSQRALLTGEPVGDWHLTIGNPFNPIAMIGNLVCTNVKIDWSNELGPDDFPIGFDATVTLKHGIGRDRDAIESMFNRGYGRIYSLSQKFRSSADGETKVDQYTGGVNTVTGRTHYDEIRNTYFGGGTRFIAKIQQGELQNKGAMYHGGTRSIYSLTPTNPNEAKNEISTYYVNPWQMGMNM